MIKNILTIFVHNVKIEKLFYQNRNILHYCYAQFIAKIIETLVMLCIHINKKLNIFTENIEKKYNYTNTYFFVKINIFLFFDVFDMMNNQKNL